MKSLEWYSRSLSLGNQSIRYVATFGQNVHLSNVSNFWKCIYYNILPFCTQGKLSLREHVLPAVTQLYTRINISITYYDWCTYSPIIFFYGGGDVVMWFHNDGAAEVKDLQPQEIHQHFQNNPFTVDITSSCTRCKLIIKQHCIAKCNPF